MFQGSTVKSIIYIAILNLFFVFSIGASEQIKFTRTGEQMENARHNIGFQLLLCSAYYEEEGKKELAKKYLDSATKIYSDAELGQNQFYFDQGKTIYLSVLNKKELKEQNIPYTLDFYYRCDKL